MCLVKNDQWRQLISTPRKLDNGQLIWDGVQIDITERKRIEKYQKNINEIQERILSAENIEQLQENIVDAMFSMFGL